QGHAACGAARATAPHRPAVRRRAAAAMAPRNKPGIHRHAAAAAHGLAAAARMKFDPQYVDHVLSDNFEDAKTLFVAPLMAVHYAHLVMLADRGIVTADEAHTLRDALDSISVRDVKATPYDRAVEDLFFHVEGLLERVCVGE